MKDLKPELQIIAKYLINELLQELEKREHMASGNLAKSVEVLVLKIVGGFNLQGKYLSYGADIEKGTKPGKLVPLSNLVQWIRYKKMRGLWRGNASAKSIQSKIKKEGIRPSPWQDKVLTKTEPVLLTKIEDIAEKHLYLLVENMIANTIKLLKDGDNS